MMSDWRMMKMKEGNRRDCSVGGGGKRREEDI
jgi:hypothetical protein